MLNLMLMRSIYISLRDGVASDFKALVVVAVDHLVIGGVVIHEEGHGGRAAVGVDAVV